MLQFSLLSGQQTLHLGSHLASESSGRESGVAIVPVTWDQMAMGQEAK